MEERGKIVRVLVPLVRIYVTDIDTINFLKLFLKEKFGVDMYVVKWKGRVLRLESTSWKTIATFNKLRPRLTKRRKILEFLN